MSGSTNDAERFEAAAQQRVLDAIEAREVADFTSLPAEQRQLSAGFLQGLISGVRQEIACPLRIRGADIVGALRPPSAGPNGGRAAVQFWSCRFDSPVDMSGAEFLVLRFVDCRLPAFIGASLRVGADLDLSGSQFLGVSDYESELSQVGTCAIHLNNARIGGKLDLSSIEGSRFTAYHVVRLDGARIEGDVSLAGALLDGCGDAALSGQSIVVGSNVDLRPAHGHRFEAAGEVGFAAANITGDLMCDAARLCNRDGRALHCEDLRVESVFLTSDDSNTMPFEARGRLNFLTAVVGGSFFMTNARLAPGPDYGGLLSTGGPVAINLQQARLSNALAFSNIGAIPDGPAPALLDQTPIPVRGWFLLTSAQLNSIIDTSETGWPEAGYLALDGATYERIRHFGAGDLTAKRIAWLRRQYPGGRPSAASFRPQPYEQLSRVLRQHGLANEANAIAVEKIRARLEARVDRPWARLFPQLLMLISQYGYSTRRAVASFLVFVLLGTAMYATALFGFGQPFLPVESDPEPVTYRFAFGMLETSAQAGCPGLHVMHFALDAALPVIDLAQDQRCRFTPEGSLRWLWLLLNSVYVIAGAALSAVVVLTLTGVLRRD
ncbi:MAG: hypothetical protein V2I25_02765 [Woeseiaceae bacterium]|jgi:hypothetical protein|nr:hypothetical protein [Woeseiaceae bacterium]